MRTWEVNDGGSFAYRFALLLATLGASLTTLTCGNSAGQRDGEETAASDTSETDSADGGLVEDGGADGDTPEYALPEIDSDELTIIVLPDTQSYVALMPDVMAAQTAWIALNSATLGIAFTAHVGDVVMSWDEDPDEWSFAQRCMADLDLVAVPYGLVPGNHDYQRGNRDSAMFNQYFPIETFMAMPTFQEAFEPDKSDNTFHLVTHMDTRIGVLLLEFGPRQEVIEWANDIVTAHSDYPFIIVTHAYLDGRNQLLGPDNPDSPQNGFGLDDATDAVTLWNELIRIHPNIRMVVSGHAGNDHDGAGLLVTENDYGVPVYQIMANYQEFSPETAGYLLVLSFEKRPPRVQVTTYAPSRDVFVGDSDGHFTIEGTF